MTAFLGVVLLAARGVAGLVAGGAGSPGSVRNQERAANDRIPRFASPPAPLVSPAYAVEALPKSSTEVLGLPAVGGGDGVLCHFPWRSAPCGKLLADAGEFPDVSDGGGCHFFIIYDQLSFHLYVRSLE